MQANLVFAPFAIPCPPLGIAMLKSYVEKNSDFSVKCFDFSLAYRYDLARLLIFLRAKTMRISLIRPSIMNTHLYGELILKKSKERSMKQPGKPCGRTSLRPGLDMITQNSSLQISLMLSGFRLCSRNNFMPLPLSREYLKN